MGNLGSAAGNGGDDANFVAIVELGVLIVQKSDILAVDVEVDESTQLALLIAEASLDAWKLLIELVKQVMNAATFAFDAGLVAGKFLQWGWNQNFDRHVGKKKRVILVNGTLELRSQS